MMSTGTYGKVVLATSHSTGQHCAIKVLDKEHVVRCKQVEHTLSEKSLLAEMKCPFIVTMISSFKDNANLYLVLEFVPGGELFFHLRLVRWKATEEGGMHVGSPTLNDFPEGVGLILCGIST